MKKFFNLILITFFVLTTYFTSAFSDTPYFIDFSRVLNQSKAGKEAQTILKTRLESSVKKFNKEEQSLREEEKKLISDRKDLSNEDYQKKVMVLRNKVADLQKRKKTSFQNIGKIRSESKEKLLVALKPLIKKYMEQKNIKLVIDKKTVLLGDANLEITNEIIELLNKELKSLNIK